MSKYGPTKENMLLALPHVLRQDPNMLALADSIATVLSAQWDEIDLLRIYQRIDELDEDLLDILAYDFKVDWWDYNYSLDVKRQTLKDNWRVHRMLGTRAALELALSAIYPGARAEEWFEYGGTPYCFRLYIDASDADIGDAKHRRVLDRVNYWKNLRSHLEGIEYHKTIPTGNLYAGVGIVTRRHISILNARQQASELTGTQYAAAGLQAMPHRTILNGGRVSEAGVAGKQYAASGVHTERRISILNGGKISEANVEGSQYAASGIRTEKEVPILNSTTAASDVHSALHGGTGLAHASHSIIPTKEAIHGDL